MELTGVVRDRIPLVTIEFVGEQIDACVDTSFDGALMVPESLAKKLQLKHLYDAEFEAADGELKPVKIYGGEVLWLGEKRTLHVLTTKGDFALVGVTLLEGTRLEMEASRGYLRISKL